MTAVLASPHTGPVAGADGARSGAMFEVRLGSAQLNHAVYVRRRLVAGLTLFALCSTFGTIAHSVLADRGGVPASTPAIQPVAARGKLTYTVQPGDTLWSIADRLRGPATMVDYVDRLVASNGGAAVQAGQLLTLP